MLARAVRMLVIAGLGALAVGIGLRKGRAEGFVALTAFTALLVIVYVILPRLAHRAFEQGRHARAGALYRIVRLTVVDVETRGAIDVSLAGCLLAKGDWDGALARLQRLDPTRLGVSARAALWNNRAYALARGKANGPAALRDVDEAMKLRPDVAGYRHTRGLALLVAGSLDDAIAELEAVWQRAGEDEPLLEAERCYDLGIAWLRKGERDYARDYFLRARSVAPTSSWASMAELEARAIT
jgi:tetratricopeptide (TPR) repeat protein